MPSGATLRITVPGLDAEADVLRDPYGVPHVRAASIRDAFYAQGYLAALDRGQRMEGDRRRALGRWAEVVGASAVRDDIHLRRVGLAAAARRSHAVLDDATKAILVAYAEGVNAVFAEGLPESVLPTPLDPWEPWHCCLVYLGRHLGMGSLAHKLFRTALLPHVPAGTVWRLRPNAQEELAVSPPGTAYRSLAGAPPEDWGRRLADWLGGSMPAADGVPLADPHGGSNNWAVSGARTATGRPLLAGDPHRPLETPSPYWQNHVSCPDLDVIGLSFPGVPGFPHFGHNRDVAWSITHGMGDDQDLFIEDIRGLPSSTETIQVRGGDPVEFTVRTSPRGGIIAEDEAAGTGLALRWTGIAEPDPTLNCILPMLTAGSAAEFDASMRGWVVPVDNLLTADTAGAIRYRLRGRLPERAPANGWGAVPGDDPAYAWTGWVPFDAMPSSVDPPEGFLVSANNRAAASETPYIAYDFAGPARASRILQLLCEADAGPLDRAAMERIHADVHSPTAAEFVSLLDGASCETIPDLVDILKSWDGTMSVDSVAASVYTVVRQEILSALDLPANLGSLDRPLRPDQLANTLWLAFPGLLAQVAERDRTLFPDWSGTVSRALDRAAVRLTEELGPDFETWTWGRLHHAVFTPVMPGVEPFPSRPVPGDSETVRAGSLHGVHATAATSGSVARYVFDLADWNESGWVIPEQTEHWYDCRLVPMLYDWDRIEASCSR